MVEVIIILPVGWCVARGYIGVKLVVRGKFAGYVINVNWKAQKKKKKKTTKIHRST